METLGTGALCESTTAAAPAAERGGIDSINTVPAHLRSEYGITDGKELC